MFIGKVICLLQIAKAWQRINTYVIETNNKRRNALHDFWDSWVRYISSQITYLIRENSLLKVNSKMLLQKMIHLFLNFKGQIILLLNLPFFSLVVSKIELGPTKAGQWISNPKKFWNDYFYSLGVVFLGDAVSRLYVKHLKYIFFVATFTL